MSQAPQSGGLSDRLVDGLLELISEGALAPGDSLPTVRELAAASGNQVLFEVVDSLLAARSREQRALRAQIENRGLDYEQHVAIFLAVESGDAEQARLLTEQHLRDLRTTVTDHLGTIE